ncbi:acyl-CoA carboxylase subunit beta [Desertibacillus haloalkaliphilus]|uniref:acyl-CoA carboxylase subunit beta n=1 Tax=Desertibacillus haloalkaliphilus TaxID=1328930 RepID=UPI001C2711E5|nr:carboxyl transferase domain-containing protein [Desertibacillus haloalkaliphilus]MBU8906944.1 methylmalonyl-CoA decarboxylase [Desertibacillus haloalkaliphilus]
MDEEITMRELIEELESRRRRAELMGGKEKIDQLHQKGFYTARERIEKLLDPGSFVEIGKLAHSDFPGAEEKSAGDGIICGIGKVGGRPIAVEAIDKTVFAGTEGAVHIRKSETLHEYALKRRFPIFHLGEGGGLRMPDGMGSDGFSDKLFPNQWLTIGRKVPVISSILGDSYGGPTWMAVSSDFVTQVKGSCMAVAGPRMLEIATGEKVTPEELGGWQVHAEVTGQIDHTSETEEEAIEAMKRYFSYMPLHAGEEPPLKGTSDSPDRSIDEVLDIVPTRRTRAYDMKKLIKVLVDDGEFFEMKPMFGQSLLTVLARLNGRVVGIIANQPMKFAGSSGPDECDKATDFICLCDSFHIPIVFLHDIPGFRVSSGAEKKRVPSKIMVWNQALARVTVPKVSVIIRKSIGAAYGNMCGPTMGGDFVVAWPTAEINFTGPEVGVNVVYGRKLKDAKNPKEERQRLLQKWGGDSSPYKAAGKGMIDDVIDPRETRKFLCKTIEYACMNQGAKSERLLADWPTSF